MASTLGPDVRRARLLELAASYGIHDPAPVVLSPPAPSARTSADDFHSEELLKRRRLTETSDKSAQGGGFKRAFGSNKKTWDPKEIFDALNVHVRNGGAPGVADALVAKLVFAGGDFNVSSVKSKASLLTRRKSIESMERSRVLQTAIDNRQPDMVAVLVQYADPLTIDAALASALHSGDLTMIQLLLQRGANVSQTQSSQDAFRQMCIMGGHAEVIALVLQSAGRPSSGWLSMSLVDATRKGCLETVLRLTRSTADGDYNNAEALREAISRCRVDIALAILTGAKPPMAGGQGLMESFNQLFKHATIGPNDKMAFTEALLCAGAYGEPLAVALSRVCDTGFYDMVDMLIGYGAPIEYREAEIVKRAVAKGQSSLVQLLVNEKSSLSPIYASECVAIIPKTVSPEERHALLGILLRKGAAGNALHDALISAVEACDMQSIDLLLTPQFPGGRTVSSNDLRNGSRGMAYDRHEVASVDHKNGLVLSIAVRQNNIQIVKQLLSGRPSPETLALVFPQVNALPSADRYLMTERFLAAGLAGPAVSATLQEAIEEQPPRRDERLISLLLRHNANVNFNDGAGVLSAIAIRDVALLETLLQTNPGQQTLAAGMTKAMAVEDKSIRYQLVRLLINAGAGRDGTEVSAALVQLLPVKPVDMQLAALLLEYGRADANFDQSAPVTLALNDLDSAVFELVLQHGKPNAESLGLALASICEMPTTPAKFAKVSAVLRRSPPRDTLDLGLYREVQTILKTPVERRDVAVLKSLLSAGADVNAHKAAALCSAVKAANSQVVDILFGARPAPESLGHGLPLSVNIVNPPDRLSFTQKLINAGAPGTEANRALVYAISAHPTDNALIGLLASHAEATGGEALLLAIKKENADFVSLLLERTNGRYSAVVMQSAFEEALKTIGREGRVRICQALLRKGLSGPIVSDALLAAAADGDLKLGSVLMEHGASVEHQDGQAIVKACGAGAPEVLGMLLAGKTEVKQQTLTKGFQAATQVGDLKTRAVVLRQLLERGVSGEAVDAQLVSAAKFGGDGEDLVRLLLEFGANVDYNSGEAIWNATRSAFMGSLKTMLGIERIGARQTKPSTATLLRALKASRKLGRDPRYQVIEWLFEAGLPATEDIHIALNRAVKDEPDLRLIRLLLQHGASPLVNSCETLIDAAQMLLSDVLTALLEIEIPQKDISWAFRQAFTPETAGAWLSEQGFQVAGILLAKGAEGESLSVALSTAIDAYGTEKDPIARKFAEVLLRFRADVSHEDGLVVRKAAKRADSMLIQVILQQKPDSRAVSMAFPYLFDSDLSEEETLQLITLFTNYHDGEERLDPMFSHAESEPVMFRALTKFPRSLRIVEALLDAGYYYDQTSMMRVMDDMEEEEPVSLLFWTLFQPQKRVSSAIIELLIRRGAKVNFQTPLSHTTPLMLAIQAKRIDLVGTLILEGAEVDVCDITENTPMTMATKIGGDIGTMMMSKLLAADPSKNDGSLHNAARELNLNAMQVLLDFGHDPDFPSTLHGGRSALGELCLNAAQETPLTAAREKLMEKAITLLMERGTDLTIQADGKSVLLLALHSSDPIPTTRALLKTGMWKFVNRPFNHFTDGKLTYSASQYAARVLPQSDFQAQLVDLLKANRTTDVYYANEGPQPEGAINLPEELLRAERERKAWQERVEKETTEHTIALSRTKEIAQLQKQIFLERTELEAERARRLREDEIGGIERRQAIEQRAFAAELERRKAERDEALRHEQKLLEAGLSRTQVIADAEFGLEQKKRQQMIEYEQQRSVQSVANAKQLSEVRIRERQVLDRIDAASDARTVQRIAEHKRLVESQGVLAAQIASGGGGGGVGQRNQIGYVTGELN
ncbi:hypothetical protein OQA88_2723 [Cercophora sp. LCS_1]